MWIFILLGVCLIFLYVMRSRILKKQLNLPPEYPDRWPIIGSAHLFIGPDTKVIVKSGVKIGDYLQRHEGIAQLYMGPIRFVHPDDYLTVINTCLEKNHIYEFMKPWLGDGLVSVTSNLDVWKRHRKIISRAFNQQVLDSYVDIFNKESRRLVEELAAKVGRGPFDHMDILLDLGLRTMFKTTMGFKDDNVDDIFDVEHKKVIKTMFQILAKRAQRVWLLSQLIYNFTSLKKQEDETLAILHKKTNDLDLPPGEAFTIQEIKDEVETMIMAGSDTSATMLTYALILLGSHQEVQDKLYAEINEVLGNRDIEKQDFKKLVFLEAVLLETMRLYPVLPALIRYVSKDIKLSKNQAMMFMKTVVSHLLRHYRINADVSKLEIQVDCILKPASGCEINIENRNK